MKERFQNFMRGRYGEGGTDELSGFLMIAALVLAVLSVFIRGGFGRLLNILWMAAIIFGWYRLLSRDFTRRYDENRRFLDATAGIRRWFVREKDIMAQRKDYHIYSCPGCRQKIRIPRGKGRVEISCPKCHTKFIKKA